MEKEKFKQDKSFIIKLAIMNDIIGQNLRTKSIIPIIICIYALGLYGCPKYNVWQQGLSGEAELKKAEWNRQITIKEAQAKLESAKSLAQADVERAKGVAEANRIIGHSLTDNEAYLRYLWIHNLESTSNQIIYVPTEGSLPILEAGHRHGK